MTNTLTLLDDALLLQMAAGNGTDHMGPLLPFAPGPVIPATGGSGHMIGPCPNPDAFPIGPCPNPDAFPIGPCPNPDAHGATR